MRIETVDGLNDPKVRYVKWFKHWKSGKIIRASDYGLEAFPIKRN